MKTTAILLVAMLSMVTDSYSQSPSNKGAVQLSATVQSAVPRITVSWPIHSGASSYTIYRRVPGITSWGSSIGNLSGSASQFVDNAVAVGEPYEYKVMRSGNGTGYGYMRSGLELPSIDMRGKMVLLVEQQIANAVPNELAQLVQDLNADGWVVLRHDVMASATPQSVRSIIQADYSADPVNVKGVYLIGHVPIPRTGIIYPDGHTDHRGAWSCDGYYGEMDGNWSDASANTVAASYSWNHNVPGDNRFDQSDFPSALELQVGRVDLSDLPSFSASEVQLTKNYLDKAHAFKTRQFEPLQRGIFFDDLQWVGNPLGSSGLQSISTCVGFSNIIEPAPSAAPYSSYLSSSFLMTYLSGSGSQGVVNNQTSFNGVNNQCLVSDLALLSAGGVFNMSFGSYFGDWDNTDNYLRAMLASGVALTHVWSGIPNWFLHPMAMGDPIGTCALIGMNNVNSNYTLQTGGWQSQGIYRSHMGLMGDPSLRLKYVLPPTGLVATNASWYASFNWSASTDTVLGYHIYKFDDAAGTISRITPNIVTGTSFVSSVQFFPGDRYMVRAVKLETSASGTYHNLSLGDIAIAQGTQIADCEGLIGGSSIPGAACDDNDPTTGLDVYDMNCNCAGFPLDCAGTPGGVALPGTPCNDNDPLTINDIYDAQCTCAGTSTIGIEEFEQNRFRIAPNPANEMVTITSEQAMHGQLILYTTSGQLIKRAQCDSQYCQIRVHDVAAGDHLLLYVPASSHEQRAISRCQIFH